MDMTPAGLKKTVFEQIRERFFYSNQATGITVVACFVLALVLWRLVDWAILNAVFRADPNACYQASGACWGFVTEKWRLIIFGRFPYEEQWRPAVATGAIVLMLVVSACPRFWNRRGSRLLLIGWCAAFIVFFGLMYGGFAGLTSVSTDNWGGLPLTVILTLLGIAVSIPIGIVLALGRRSELSVVRVLSTGYIELVRGVPLITVLFVASFVFPLLLPSGIRIDPFWRVAGGIILFQAAYMAETVRGGLQTVPVFCIGGRGCAPAVEFNVAVLEQLQISCGEKSGNSGQQKKRCDFFHEETLVLSRVVKRAEFFSELSGIPLADAQADFRFLNAACVRGEAEPDIE